MSAETLGCGQDCDCESPEAHEAAWQQECAYWMAGRYPVQEGESE